MFFRDFWRSGLAIPFSGAILCGTPFSGRRVLWQRNSAMRRAGAGHLPGPTVHPRGWSRGLLNSRNLNRQVGLFATESLILAQNERWRHGLGMQVERRGFGRGVAKGCATRGEPAPGPGTSAGNGV